ncbi:hypothetical protein J2Z31_005181 [Sinorhizobium kostiense]|uniref:Uncharacterized protein n=1 Tax=Sinorhizobium kostiense TaxID=76747 RepID=A0ABS4R6W3_9HYPH|nr:hypothetical protein [Sinorhizobium kostiense]MBP2238640.1 hypothetical protein [Sinorhizobium kostiense]
MGNTPIPKLRAGRWLNAERFPHRSDNEGGSEELGPDQRHDKIGCERDGDGEADESFEHRTLLKPAERTGVERKYGEAAGAGSKKQNVGHVPSPDV